MKTVKTKELIPLITKDNSGVTTRFRGTLQYGISFLCNYDVNYYKQNYAFFQDFKSGNDVLDNILHKELHRHNECLTFLFYQNGDKIPIAFCSMCCSAIHIEEQINDKLEKIMHPAIEFRYFAVRKDKQNTCVAPEYSNEKISSYIFNECMYYAYILSTDAMAAEYFVLHALDSKKVRAFYKRHGFTELPVGVDVATDITLQHHCIPAYLLINKSFNNDCD